MASELKTIVVIGAGPFTGIAIATQIAKQLPSTHRVVLIDRRDFAWFTFVAARGSVVPGWEDKTIVPLKDVFSAQSRHKVVQTEVVDFDNESVTLKEPVEGFGSKIAAEVVILATASSYSFPATASDQTQEQAKQRLRDFQAQVKNAKSLLIVGGGPYGVEFAGEVADLYKNDPRQITLVSSAKWLIGEPFPQSFGNNLQKQLESRGVTVILNDRVDLGDVQSGPIERRTFTTQNGKSIDADFVLGAAGSKPNSDWIKSKHPELLLDSGRLKTRPTLQLESLDRVFASGDLAGLDIPRSGVNATMMTPVIVKNALSLVKGQKPAATFKPGGQILGVTVGTTGGSLALPFMNLGAFLTKYIKSRGLFFSSNEKNYKMAIA